MSGLIGFKWFGANAHIGDQLIFTSLPENYYKNTGEKLVNVDNIYYFSKNPYCIQGKDVHPNTLSRIEVRDMWKYSKDIVDTSYCRTAAEEFCLRWGLSKVYKTRPDLYVHSDNKPAPRTLCIATTGQTVGSMPLHVLRHIREQYKDYLTYQIGSLIDIDAGADLDRRGCDIFESCKIISECEQLITIDSAPMHLGLMYPRVWKKVILVNRTQEDCEKFVPRGYNYPDTQWRGWIELGCSYYNCYEHSFGATYSYLDI